MTDQTGQSRLPEIRVPGMLTLGGLIGGLVLGLLLSGQAVMTPILAVAGPVGDIWLQALKMTILPLVAGLLFTGVVETAQAARAGAMAQRTLGFIVGTLALSAIVGGLGMTGLLALLPVPAGFAPHGAQVSATVPAMADFLRSMVPTNVVTAAANDALLPVIVFIALFAAATTRLPDHQSRLLTGFFEAITWAMLVLIGWVLRLAPLGVFALGLTLSAHSGFAALGTLAHYIALVSSLGGLFLLLGYPMAMLLARRPLAAFARAVLPAQVVAISTQSSLASLPTMLASCRNLGVASITSEFVLPLAVTLFRATGPAMNMGVAVYAAHMAGIHPSPTALGAAMLVAFVTTFGTVSLPGTISFIASTAPITAAIGAPLWPLAILVAVEMLPDIMRTVGNVTMDVAITASIDHSLNGSERPQA